MNLAHRSNFIVGNELQRIDMHQSRLANFGQQAKVVLARPCNGLKNVAGKRDLGSINNPSVATSPAFSEAPSLEPVDYSPIGLYCSIQTKKQPRRAAFVRSNRLEMVQPSGKARTLHRSHCFQRSYSGLESDGIDRSPVRLPSS